MGTIARARNIPLVMNPYAEDARARKGAKAKEAKHNMDAWDRGWRFEDTCLRMGDVA
jgi:hypothetical protein